MMKTISISTTTISLIFFSSVLSAYDEISPQLDLAVQDKYLQSLKSNFPTLSNEELSTTWGTEYQIGIGFARKLDLYQAITAFKRADLLIPPTEFQRQSEIQYQIVNCYYLGKKYYDVVDAFEDSILANTDRNFAAFQNLLIILFESYIATDDRERADWVLKMMEKYYPSIASKLELTQAILTADFEQMLTIGEDLSVKDAIVAIETRLSNDSNDIHLISNIEDTPLSPEEHSQLASLRNYSACQDAAIEILSSYKAQRKSPGVAGFLNGILPGAGYLYLGQTHSAFTALCLNGLFVGSTVWFAMEKNYPAAIISGGFEAGWYFGGIIGAKENAVLFNERLFEGEAHYQMRDHKLYPILMLTHGF